MEHKDQRGNPYCTDIYLKEAQKGPLLECKPFPQHLTLANQQVSRGGGGGTLCYVRWKLWVCTSPHDGDTRASSQVPRECIPLTTSQTSIQISLYPWCSQASGRPGPSRIPLLNRDGEADKHAHTYLSTATVTQTRITECAHIYQQMHNTQPTTSATSHRDCSHVKPFLKSGDASVTNRR